MLTRGFSYPWCGPACYLTAATAAKESGLSVNSFPTAMKSTTQRNFCDFHAIDDAKLREPGTSRIQQDPQAFRSIPVPLWQGAYLVGVETALPFF